MIKRVVAALIFRNKKLLLIYHKKLAMWMFVAGHVEKGETNRKAMRREVKEEVNLYVNVAKKPFYILKEHNDKNTLHYICKVNKGRVNLKMDEVTNYKWFSRKGIEKARLHKLVKKISLIGFAKSKIIKNNLFKH